MVPILSRATTSALFILWSAVGASAAVTAEQRCEASKGRAVGSYFLCVEKARAAALLKGGQLDTSDCDAKFDAKWNQLESKGEGTCPDGVDPTSLRAHLSQCVIDASGIVSGSSKIPACGDGRVNVAQEQCDGPDLGSATCRSLGFADGSLACTDSCKLDSTGCTGSTCTPGADGYADPSGCTCQPSWTYGGATYCNGSCANPDGDPNGPWCFTTASCRGENWGYCTPQAIDPACDPQSGGCLPPAGCTCRDSWAYNGSAYEGGRCGNPDNDPNGAWCYTSAPCNGANWAYCTPQ